jgi:hypothetical protein
MYMDILSSSAVYVDDPNFGFPRKTRRQASKAKQSEGRQRKAKYHRRQLHPFLAPTHATCLIEEATPVRPRPSVVPSTSKRPFFAILHPQADKAAPKLSF